MDIDKAIKERRTFEHFKKKSVPWKKINEILDSFSFSHYIGGLQNGKLVVLKNEGQLNKACLDQKPVAESDFLVVVCSDSSELVRFYKEKGKLFGIQNTAAGIQNMMLKAYSMKIGSCWIGSYDEGKVRAKLKIPDKVEIHAVIAFGYSNEKPNAPLRLDSQKTIFFNSFGNFRRDPLPLVKK